MIKHATATAALLTVLSAPTQAAPTESTIQQQATVLASVVVATAAAGPLGFVVGALAGDWLAGQVAEAEKLGLATAEADALAASLAAMELELAGLNRQLAEAQAEQARYAQMSLDQLQLEMLFTTGHSDLTTRGKDRLKLLADYLGQNPDLEVTIEGYADPRGDVGSNLALSRARAEQVASVLIEAGVSRARLTLAALGESQSTATPGDHDAYALERRVRIGLARRHSGAQVAEVILGGARK